MLCKHCPNNNESKNEVALREEFAPLQSASSSLSEAHKRKRGMRERRRSRGPIALCKIHDSPIFSMARRRKGGLSKHCPNNNESKNEVALREEFAPLQSTSSSPRSAHKKKRVSDF